MRFGNPQALIWLLTVLPMALLFWGSARRRRRRLDALADRHLQTDLAPTYSSTRTTRKSILWLLGFACCLLALARPQWGFDWQEVHRRGIDILILLDTSNSMLAEDVKPNRITRSKMAIEDLVRQLRGDRLGLVAFAGSAFLQCPMTLDYDAFLATTKALDVGYIPRGGTNLQAAVEEGLRAFGEDAPNHKAMVLITDGENLEGDLDAVVQQAVERKIRIFAVGIGTEEGELIPIRDENDRISFLRDRDGNPVKTRLNPEPLKELCAATDGMYVQAGSTDFGLQAIYEAGIAPMSPQELASRMQKRWKERFQVPLALGLILLGLGIFLPEHRPRAARRSAGLAPLLAAILLSASTASAQTNPDPIPPPPPPTAVPPADQHQPEADQEPGTTRSPEPLAPGRFRDLIKEGVAAYNAERYDDAATAFRKVLRAQPDSPLANYNNGLVLYRLGLYQKAIEHWEAVLTDLPLMAKAQFNIGNAIVRLAEDNEENPTIEQAVETYRRALNQFQKAIELDRTDDDARRNFEIIYQRILELEHQKEKMAKITEETRQETLRLIAERRYAEAAGFMQAAIAQHEFLQETLSDLIQRSQALAQIFQETGP